MTEQNKIEILNEEINPLLGKALEMGVVLAVIAVDIKPVPGQLQNPGGISTYLATNELINLLEDTLTNLKTNQ